MNNTEENSTFNSLTNGIKTLQDVRYHIKSLFRIVFCVLAKDANNSINEIHHELKAILLSYGTLEKNLNLLSSTNLSLGNLGYLSQDPLADRNGLFDRSLQAFNWSDTLQENSSAASSLLAQNSLKRSTIFNNSSKKQKHLSNQSLPSHILDAIINGLDRLFLDMSVSTWNQKPYGSTLVLNITLGTTLRAVISLHNLMIEGIVIRGYNEKELTSDDNSNYFWSEIVSTNYLPSSNETHPEIWIESIYEVFQKISDHAQAAMLHFYSPLIPELALKSFMTWLHSFTSLFHAPCHRCQKYLQDFLPPTWRDFRTLEPYHELCKY